jgi:hypothetical protein
VTPSLFRNHQLNGGLLMFFFQFVVMMGIFFVIPLYLSVALGLSAIETGIRITPLSITMLLAAAGVPKFFPSASPRRVVELGLVAVVIGLVVLLTALDVDADVPAGVSSQASVELASGIPFISDADLETALEEAGASPAVTQAVVDENEQARLDGLRAALALLALIAVVALFFTRRISERQPGAPVAGGSP